MNFANIFFQYFVALNFNLDSFNTFEIFDLKNRSLYIFNFFDIDIKNDINKLPCCLLSDVQLNKHIFNLTKLNNSPFILQFAATNRNKD